MVKFQNSQKDYAVLFEKLGIDLLSIEYCQSKNNNKKHKKWC